MKDGNFQDVKFLQKLKQDASHITSGWWSSIVLYISAYSKNTFTKFLVVFTVTWKTYYLLKKQIKIEINDFIETSEQI